MEDLKLLDFLECVETVGGFVVRHKETKWEYILPVQTEEIAWSELDRQWSAIAKGVWEMLMISGSVSLKLGPRER